MPPKKLLKTESHEASYVDSIDCAKFPCPPFYLTKVTGITDTHNSPDVAIGIKGDHHLVYNISQPYRVMMIVDILSPTMGDLEASAQVYE